MSRWARSVHVDDFATTAICEAEISMDCNSPRRKNAGLNWKKQRGSVSTKHWRAGSIRSIRKRRKLMRNCARTAARSAAQSRSRTRRSQRQLLARSGILVTRNVADFEFLALELVNPWER